MLFLAFLLLFFVLFFSIEGDRKVSRGRKKATRPSQDGSNRVEIVGRQTASQTGLIKCEDRKKDRPAEIKMANA